MKTHLSLATRDLDASVAFYATLLPVEPMKHLSDYARFGSADPGLELALDVEREETCCYADQAKVWASDPEGRRWETYFVHEEADQSACCPP